MVTGVFAYLFFASSTQTLGAQGAAPVTVLWTYWNLSAAVLVFPLQQWVTRSIAADGDEERIRRSLPKISAAIGGASALSGGIAWLVREPLFGRDDGIFPVLVAAVTVGSGFIGLVRGSLAGRRRFVATGVAVMSENALRCLLAVGLVISPSGATATAFGVALALGPLVGLLWIGSLRFAREGERDVVRGSSFPLLGGMAGASLLAQLVLIGGPLALSLSGGAAAEVTSLFVALALFRAPYLVLLGTASAITTRLTDLHRRGQVAALRAVLRRTVVLTVLAAGGGAAAAYAGGRAVLQLVFGADVTLPPGLLALLAVAHCLALGNLVLTLWLGAQGLSRRMLSAWSAGVLVGLGCLLLAPADPLERVVVGVLVTEVVTFGAMLAAQRYSRRRRRRRGGRPGSVRLANVG